MEQSADTFVRDVVWPIGSSTLESRYLGSDWPVKATLTAMQPD
jgi:hypothetical protein